MRLRAKVALGIALLSHVGLLSANAALILCTHQRGQVFIEWTDSPCCACECDTGETTQPSSDSPEIRNGCNCVDTALSTSPAHVVANQSASQFDVVVCPPPPRIWLFSQLDFRPMPEITISPQLQVVLKSLSTVVINC